MIALDASALLAFLFREPGAGRVAGLMDDACMSTVNLCEVLGRFARDGRDWRKMLGALKASAIEFVPFDTGNAGTAASLLPVTRKLGLSLGDRACLGLALSRDITAVTADHAWADASLENTGIKIDIIR